MKKFLIASIVAFALAAVATTADAAFSRNLSVGSTGTDVAELQTWLIGKGFNIPSISSGAAQPGYFGSQTQAAVSAYQTSVGLPAFGFFGPLTMAKIAGGATGSTGGSSNLMTLPFPCPAGYTAPAGWSCPGSSNTGGSTGPLAGTDGNIQSVDLLSQYSDEEVGEGENDVKVLGFEVEASNDGDIALKSIKVEIVPDGTNSDHLDDYIDGVSVWMGSTKIGSASVDDFSQASNDNWSKTVTLNSGTVVRADETEKFYITVDAVNSFDSADIDDDAHTIDVTNVRFEDGSGVVSTEDVTITAQQMDFVSFGTSADTELKISKDSSSPKAMIVVVDEDDDTDNVDVLVGKFKVEGSSDITIDELPVTLTTGGDSVGALVNSLSLTIDSEEYTESVGLSSVQTGTVTFDNLDLTLEAGKTYTFTVSADVNDINNSGVTATDFDEGDALIVSLTSTNRDYVDAENEEGDQLSDSTEKSGTAIGEGQEFRTNGIGLTLVSTESSVAAGQSANDDQGTFIIKYKITAIGDTVYVSSLADAQLSGNTSGKTTVLVDRSGTATVGGVSVTLANVTDSGEVTSTGNYTIEDGESETFELTTTVQLPTAGAAGQFRAALGGVRWGTTDIYPLANSYVSELDTFKTSYKGLN